MTQTRNLRSFVFFIFGWLLLAQLAILVFTLPTSMAGRADFRHLYTAGQIVRSGHAEQLYDYETNRSFQNKVVGPSDTTFPFDHLAWEALLFLPLSAMSYRTAYITFLVLNLGLLTVSFKLLYPILKPAAKLSALLPFVPFLGFLPVTITLVQGQDSVLLLTLFAAAMVSFERGQECTSGILIGLTLFKFQFSIPTALLFFAWRRWRFTAGFAVTAIALLILSAWLTGLHSLNLYAHDLISMGSESGQQKYLIPPVQMPNLRGLVFIIGAAMHLRHWAVQTITLGCSALLLLWTAARKPSFPLATITAVLVSYHCLIHDAALLIPPLGMAVSHAWSSGGYRTVGTRLATAVILIAPTPLLFWGTRYYLLALPMFGLLRLWDGTYWSPFRAENGRFCPQKVTG